MTDASVEPMPGHHDGADSGQTALRSPGDVMRLERMGCAYPTRLSFSRSLIRALAVEAAESPGRPLVERTVWSIDDDGYGRAVYSLRFGGHTYSLVAFSSPLEPEQRTDRVIAVAWDAAFVLFDGEPTDADLDRLAENVPRQEAGRLLPTELTLSRANKSVRFFDHVVERLASGRQPDPDLLNSVGYLMRTTAVYSNGKFGLSDRARFAARPLMADPFRAEMLTVWLIRAFTVDLVEHVASRRSPSSAVALAPDLRRHLGIGNATGLGMAPFLVDHPVLINNWALARETALARVRALTETDSPTVERLVALLDRVKRHLAQWSVEDERLSARLATLAAEVDELCTLADSFQSGATDVETLADDRPWEALSTWSQSRSLECQELVVALLLELHPELVDGLSGCMDAGPPPTPDAAMSLDELRSLLKRDWAWVGDIDFDDRRETTLFWYVSEERLEPRIGDRYQEAGAEHERPLDIARRVADLGCDLEKCEPEESLARFLIRHPEHRLAVGRVQTADHHPYSEIRDNLICADCLPIDMLRWKLAFFGASKFDPKSDLWTRIALFQGARFPDELGPDVTVAEADDWWMPVLQP